MLKKECWLYWMEKQWVTFYNRDCEIIKMINCDFSELNWKNCLFSYVKWVYAIHVNTKKEIDNINE